mmetsp:Transcript_29453/g.44938  ORF Transcript_29453/g.44938 Transcript_29453/m.44938 type:complete len:268 (+) Transcript_29453:71-874(+)
MSTCVVLPFDLLSVVISFADARDLLKCLVSFAASSEHRQFWTITIKEALLNGLSYWATKSICNNRSSGVHRSRFLTSVIDSSKSVSSFEELRSNADLFLILEHFQFAQSSKNNCRWPISCQNVYFGQGRYAKLVFTTSAWSSSFFGFRCNDDDEAASSLSLIGKVFVVDGEQSYKTCRVFGYHLSYSHGPLRARITPKETIVIDNLEAVKTLNNERSFYVKWTLDPLKALENNHVLLRREIAHRTRIFWKFRKSCESKLWDESGILS